MFAHRLHRCLVGTALAAVLGLLGLYMERSNAGLVKVVAEGCTREDLQDVGRNARVEAHRPVHLQKPHHMISSHQQTVLQHTGCWRSSPRIFYLQDLEMLWKPE